VENKNTLYMILVSQGFYHVSSYAMATEVTTLNFDPII